MPVKFQSNLNWAPNFDIKVGASGVPLCPNTSCLSSNGTILRFLRYVICSGNKQHYDYVLKWLARSIQRPQDIGEVALVLRGKKGSGKTTLGEIMRRIFGNNYLLLDDPNLLTRGFNAHLRECVFAVADGILVRGVARGPPCRTRIPSTKNIMKSRKRLHT